MPLRQPVLRSQGIISAAERRRTLPLLLLPSAYAAVQYLLDGFLSCPGNYLARERAYQRIEQKVELMKSYDEVTGLLRYDKFKEVAQNDFPDCLP